MPPPEPTTEEAAIINAAHDAIRRRWGHINWGSTTETMAEVWDRALKARIITERAHTLTKRDCGLLWRMHGGPLL